MSAQKGWRRISSFRLTILVLPYHIHREALPHSVKEFNAHITTITERSVTDYKKQTNEQKNTYMVYLHFAFLL